MPRVRRSVRKAAARGVRARQRDSEPERSAALGTRRFNLRRATSERSAEGPHTPRCRRTHTTRREAS